MQITNSDNPLFVFVHGRGGNVDVMRPFLRVIPEDSNYLFIQAPEAENDKSVGGYSWWQVGQKDKVPIRAQEVIVFLKTFISENRLSPSKIIGLGFSQGGALLSSLVQIEGVLFERIALLASFVVQNPEPNNVRQSDHSANNSDTQKIQTKVLMIHGTADQIITIERAEESVEILKQLGTVIEIFKEESIGHKLGIQGMKKLKEWVNT